MSIRLRTASDTRLVTVAGDGLVGDNRIALSPADLPTESAGLLVPSAVDREQAWAIRLVPLPELSPGIAVCHEDFARSAGLSADATDWLLSVENAETADSAVLEASTDLPLAQCVKQLLVSTALDGQVFRSTAGNQSAASWLNVNGVPYRVRSVADSQGSPLTGLVRIGTTTTLHLFAPGSRAGVDVVILADCSASMSWDDVLDTGDVSRTARRRKPYLTRMEALKRALQQMADSRLSIAGRTTRLALVRFTTRSSCIYPRHGGMAEIGTGDEDDEVREFRAAIGLLKHEEAGTDIGQALHFASELLYRYGLPQNDRLIVLVSDGADWSEKDEKATGEMLAATADPVSLMEELNDSLGIRLHAIGIGDEQTFATWWQENHGSQPPHVSIVPNHRLLRHLVEVGGGDPTRIGGMEILEEYFGELATGISRVAGRPHAGQLPKPQPEIAAAVAAAQTADAELSDRRRQLADKIQQLYVRCIEVSKKRIGQPIYRHTGQADSILRIGEPATSRATFTDWILEIHQIFREQQDSRLNSRPSESTYPLQEIHRIVWDGRLGRIHTLRLDFAHAEVGRENKGKAQRHQLDVGKILYELTNQYHLEPDDAKGWSLLQCGLMDGLSGMLQDIYQTLQTAPLPEKPESPNEPPPDSTPPTLGF
ncbi:vWA domain-containing protein [Kitasatospora sp. NPDC059571]|uniref:vWA domain-containing protein n=1 Tax=Kitasatospora sp. NPDC059571 TaxID=3346871 RepID=UPI0036BC0344